MKKYIAGLLALLMVFSFVSCGGNKENDSSANEKGYVPKEKTDFGAYLDEAGFVPGMTQTVFLDKMEGYCYDGQPITEIAIGHYYDSEDGGGYRASDQLFGFSNGYIVEEDGKSSVSINKFYTHTALEGFSLPHGITFEDTLEEAFEKMGLSDNPRENFVADKGSDTEMTLASTDGWRLVFKNLKLTKDPVDYTNPYRIYYSETYTLSLENGKRATVTRDIELCFFDDGFGDKNTLESISIMIKQSSPIS